MTIACMNTNSSNRSLKPFLINEAEETLRPRSSWFTSQQHLQVTGMVFPICQPVWEEAFPTVRHIWRAGSSSGLPSTMHGHTGDRPKKGHEDSEGPEASDIQREAKRAEPVQRGEEKAQGNLNTVHKYLMGGIKNGVFFSVVLRDRTENKHKLKYGKVYLSVRRKVFFLL